MVGGGWTPVYSVSDTTHHSHTFYNHLNEKQRNLLLDYSFFKKLENDIHRSI